jgi:hypothetical protein
VDRQHILLLPKAKVVPWRAQYDESCRLCSEGSSLFMHDLFLMAKNVRFIIRTFFEAGTWYVHETTTYPVADVSGSSPLTSNP